MATPASQSILACSLLLLLTVTAHADRSVQPKPRPSVLFVAGGDSRRVSFVLAESQLRVRLAHDVQLHCDLTSRDAANIDPELQLGIGVKFRFR